MYDHLRLRARLTQFEGSRELSHVSRAIEADGGPAALEFGGAEWKITPRITTGGSSDCVAGEVVFAVCGGEAKGVSVALEWEVASWSPEVFVMLPAAAYGGNRFPCRHYRYPPMVHEPDDIGPAAPILVTDVPRLSVEADSPSRIQISTGDVTTPCIAFHDPHSCSAVILLTEQGVSFGGAGTINHGLTVEESSDRRRALLRIEAPCVRRETLYTMVNTATPSWDHGADWSDGTEVSIRYRLYRFPAPTVQSLFDRFAAVRKDLCGAAELRNELPFSAASRIIEEKQQRENWCEAGYFRVGTHEAAQKSPYQDWQVGWVGGGMVPFPFLLSGWPESRARALTNLEWMFASAQHASGFFHSGQHDGKPYGDGFGVTGTEAWYMVRKQADALYFLMKTFLLLRADDPAWVLPAGWEAGTRLLADRFVSTFRLYGQLGQYLHCDSGDVVVGGSTAAAMAPGALALTGEFFRRDDYLTVAEALAERLDEDVRSGITVGGPGEILKCADSESAFAMLESFVVLYEVTRKPRWLQRAEAIAAQCLTWCASYDFRFPADSPLGSLDIRAAGSVWANVQNKHSAPGICTLSGDSLFKLFRYTGNTRWLEAIRETAHNITQYLSRSDRPVGDPAVMRPGYVCERVNFSDWEGKDQVGGNLFGSCWPEVSLLLTAAEIPGIYVQPDSALLCVFDHVEVKPINVGGAVAALEITNPTAFDAEVRLFVELSQAASTILAQAAALRWPVVPVPAGETRTVRVGEARASR